MSKKMYYYAFGSNLLIERLQWRIGRYGIMKPPIPYILKDYELVFNCGQELMGSCFANIQRKPGEQVEGLLYEVNREQLRALDMYEACYHRVYTLHPDGAKIMLYIGRPDCILKTPARPSLGYINIILDGCMQNNLSYTYKKVLEYKNRNYKLKSNKHKSWQ